MLSMMLMFAAAIAGDLSTVKAEANPVRRVELGLDYANATLDKAKSSYSEAQYDKSRTDVLEIQEAVEVSYEALRSTGKDPRKSPKEFKRFEQRIQALVRRLKGFSLEVSVEDRPVIRKVESRLEDINDEIVSGIFKKAK
jgi:septation ring formation regulator EzrA